MNSALRFFLLLLFFCLAVTLPAGGGKEKAAVVQVSGKVRLVGSGPLPELVISGPDKEWYVDRDEQHKLKDLQHRTVTVEGNETVTSLKFASGLPAGERRVLRNIKIISVQ